MLIEECDPVDSRYPILKKIEKQSFRASRIINNLLNFSRKKEKRLDSIDVQALIVDTLSLMEYEFRRQNVRVNRDFAGETLSMAGVEGELQQVLMNLFLNALDSMPGGGDLHIRTRHGAGDRVIIEVGDTGTGIPAEYIDRIFDPFFTTKEGK